METASTSVLSYSGVLGAGCGDQEVCTRSCRIMRPLPKVACVYSGKLLHVYTRRQTRNVHRSTMTHAHTLGAIRDVSPFCVTSPALLYLLTVASAPTSSPTHHSLTSSWSLMCQGSCKLQGCQEVRVMGWFKLGTLPMTERKTASNACSRMWEKQQINWRLLERSVRLTVEQDWQDILSTRNESVIIHRHQSAKVYYILKSLTKSWWDSLEGKNT